MRRIEQFDERNDFWTTFPELSTYPLFSDFKKKKNSSLIMWALHKCEHPKSLIFRDPNKYEVFAELFDQVEEEKLELLREKYRTLILSPGESALIAWRDNLKKLNDYVEDIDLDVLKTNEVKSVSEMMNKMVGLFKVYPDLVELIRGEEDQIKEKVSLSEEGII